MSKNIKHFLLLAYLIIFSHSKILSPHRNPIKGYPTRKSIKGIQPDFQDPDLLIKNSIHGVAMNLIWKDYQPQKTSECSEGQIKYEGYCYTIDPTQEQMIKKYTENGVVVTGVIYGVPEWARIDCSGFHVVSGEFCAPKQENAEDYGRFAGFLAYFFNGENGHGRVADFVIHNEVNDSEWFNYGCNKDTCDIEQWTTVYSQSWNAAYDFIKKEQTDAKVLISFEHQFDPSLDYLIHTDVPKISSQTFLRHLIPKLNGRIWRIAFHCYPKDISNPFISSDDYPIVTFGNIGILAGWLRQNYPNNPESWEVQLTENGFNGANPSMYAEQERNLCIGVRNILGTPGIESLIYHRLKDHPVEVRGGLGLGLWDSEGNHKPSWETYSMANQNGGKCGFEDLPYVRMVRGCSGIYHWVSTRMMPRGFNPEHSYLILREKEEDTEIVYECRFGGYNGDRSFISKDVNCEGHFNMGPMGYIWSKNSYQRVPIFRCCSQEFEDHFISDQPDCEGKTKEFLVGYALAGE